VCRYVSGMITVLYFFILRKKAEKSFEKALVIKVEISSMTGKKSD
jgi:hypothetical protein